MAASKPTSTGQFKCFLCEDTFYTNKQLVSHKSVHAKEYRTFTCLQCNTCFTDHCEYLLHEVNHLHHRSEHKCVECGLIKKKICLPMHIMTHFEQKKQACEFCDEVLTVEELKKHVKKHSIFNRKQECTICGQMIVCWKYETHFASHSNVRKHRCPHCNKVFSSKGKRKSHSVLHTEESIEVCDICGLVFKSLTHLKWHKKKHKMEIKYQCDYCNKEFLRKTAIAIHIQKHLGVRCAKCKFMAPTRDKLVQHLKDTHYHCSLCGVGYKNSQSLKIHFYGGPHKAAVVRKNQDSPSNH